jgi:aldose 1-epimerase
VDHPINAMNLAGGACENGMTLLGRGERLTRTFRFTVERTGLRSMPGARGSRRRQ